MPRLSFFHRKDLSEEENLRWMIYWAIYGATIFIVFFSLNKAGVDSSIWLKIGIAVGVLLIFGVIYSLDTRRRKKRTP